jgi:hypothetical protein
MCVIDGCYSEVIKKMVKRKFRKDKDSPEEEIETEKEYQRKEWQAVKPVAGHHYTWMKIADAKKEGTIPHVPSKSQSNALLMAHEFVICVVFVQCHMREIFPVNTLDRIGISSARS